jgi:hypothetical protein
VRDAQAVLEVSSLLHAGGFSYGGLIANPGESIGEALGEIRDSTPEPAIGCDDVVLVPGRPPLSDSGKRRLDRSRSAIEQAVFAALGTVLRRCERSEVELSEGLLLPDGARRFEHVSFFPYQGSVGAVVQNCGPHGGRQERPEREFSIGYLVSIPAGQTAGFRVLTFFGMGGTETFVLASLLRQEWQDVFARFLSSDHPCLMMATFEVPKWTPLPMLSYDPRGVRAEIVLDVEIAA